MTLHSWLPVGVKDAPWKHTIMRPGMMFPDLDESPVLCVDVETKPRPQFAHREKAGLSPHHAELLGLCLGVPGHSFYFPMRHRAPGSEEWNIDPNAVMSYLRDTVKTKKVIVNQTLKFDAKMLKENGGDHANNVDLLRDAPQADVYCTMIASQLIDERWATHSLKPVCERVLGVPATEQKIINNFCRDAGQNLKKHLDYSVVPADIMGKYGCKDGELPLRLAAWQLGQLDSQQLWTAFNLEMRTLKTLVKCETLGFRVDTQLLAMDLIKYSALATRLEEALHKIAGVAFNPTSANEIAEVVDVMFGLKVKKVYDHKKKEWKAKVDDVVLQEYIHDYPERGAFFFMIRMVRRLRHLLSSFIDSYRYHNIDGIIYPNFNQLSPKSGTRMTSGGDTAPNVQQVSAAKYWKLPADPGFLRYLQALCPEMLKMKDDAWHWVAPGARQYFIPRDGHALLFFDQSQIEYRMFAHYAGNQRMIDAYKNDATIDLHEWMRVNILDSMIERRPAKNVHFGIVYGMAKLKTAKSMQVAGAKISIEQAEALLDKYHAMVPEVKRVTWGEGGMAETLKRRGYLCSILGGRRRLNPNYDADDDDDTNDSDAFDREGIETSKGAKPYQGLNVCCQRSSMDVLKYTMNNADAAGYTTLTPIHDELIFEPRLDDAPTWAWNLKQILQKFTKPDGTPYLKVPIYVEGKYAATRWSEAEKIEFE